MFKFNNTSFQQKMETNGLFIAIIIAALLVNCTMVLIKNKEKTKTVEKKIELKANVQHGTKKN